MNLLERQMLDTLKRGRDDVPDPVGSVDMGNIVKWAKSKKRT